MQVTIETDEVPRAGTSQQLLVRMRIEDYPDVIKAARKLKMRQSEFLRTAIINVARQVAAEK